MKKNESLNLKLRGLPAVRQGMSLVEAIIGIFIFGVVMFAVTNIFTSSFGAYRKAEKMAKNIEEAQFAMQTIAKSLRTSKVFSAYSTPSTIRSYDYSQGLCNEYIFTAGGAITRSVAADSTCATVGASNQITAQYIQGSFYGASSAPAGAVAGTMGKVTIRMKVCSDAGCPANSKNDFVILQTTVSLRDYSTVGL